MLPARGKGREDIIELLESIGRVLNKPVRAYILGGAVLTLRGVKESTLDIDIIVEDSDSYRALVEALQALGFIREDKLRFRNPLTSEYVDVDVGKFIKLPLYTELKRDAQLLGVFGNLTVLLLPNESVILFKSLTEREKDIDDIADIIMRESVNWDKLLQTAVNVTEKELEKKGAKGIVLVYELLVALKRVNEKYPNLVPQNILRRIERVAKKYFKIWLEYASNAETSRDIVKHEYQ